MYEAVKKYCENSRKNGLYLMDMPTGFGKTFNVIKYIFDASMDEVNKDKRFFFITTLKKNLPISEMEFWFKQTGRLDAFKEKFLFIDSNVDCVVGNLSDDVKKTIPFEIAKTDEYKEFLKNVEFIQNVDSDTQLRRFAGSILDNLRTKTEPAFRRLAYTILSKDYSTVEKRLFAIKTEEKWQWLGKLYPSVFTKDRQIIFLTVDKFLSRNATIVEPSYMFANSDLLNNAIVFIDEVDATKDTLLKNIIQNGLRDRIDYVELFNAIYSSLQTNAFPTALTVPSQNRKKSEYANQTLQSVIDGIREKADAIYHNFTLQYSHRTVDENDTASRNFLFQDHQFHSILDGGKSFITTHSDSDKKINAITFSKEKPDKEINNIQVLLGKLRGFIGWFQGAINILAINYMQRKQEMRKEGEDDFSFESSVRSVLSLFRLNDEYIDFLTSQILIASHKIKGDIESSEYDRTFYENGFRYYAFEDDTAHDMQSRIMMCSFQNTPEKTLLKICEKAKVIGISATATIDTVIGNYDLDYLKAKMQNAYEPMSREDYERLKEEFEKNQAGYKDIQIHRELLGLRDDSEYCLDSWNAVFNELELSEKVYNLLEREQAKYKDNKNKNYNQQRYLRIALAYKAFITTPDIKSFLCVLTKHPKKGDNTLNLDTIYEIFRYIGWEYAPSFDTRKSVALLDGDEFESKKNTVTKRLESGDKIFVISVYQTIGAGQNLQYKAPAALKDSLIQVNERSSEEKDYDAIYLDKPTNLLVNFNSGQAIEDEEFVKALYQYEFLQESSELSADDATRHIKNAFRHYMSNGTAQKEYVQNIHDSKSIRMLATRYIIQAIGRICRTSLKNKNIYIYADCRIAECIDLSVAQNRLLNKEFVALLDLVKAKDYKSPEVKSLENEADLKSSRVNKDIRYMLEEEWNEKSIAKWKFLRELVLRHPTMSSEEVDKCFAAWNYYVQLPKKTNHYFYNQQEDFNNISISFTPDLDHESMVSADGTKLPRLMRFADLQRLFEERGYAINFEPNDYMMSPPLWNNIYKGALGEVIGKYLFEKVLQVELEEIEDPDMFELFDFKVKKQPIYVDFKNWQETSNFDWDKQLKKITSKAAKCGCKCAIIVNILTDKNSYETRFSERDGIGIVIVPSLLIENPIPTENINAMNRIRECIEKYADKDE